MHVSEDLRPAIATKICVLEQASAWVKAAAPEAPLLTALEEIIENEKETFRALKPSHET